MIHPRLLASQRQRSLLYIASSCQQLSFAASNSFPDWNRFTAKLKTSLDRKDLTTTCTGRKRTTNGLGPSPIAFSSSRILQNWTSTSTASEARRSQFTLQVFNG